MENIFFIPAIPQVYEKQFPCTYFQLPTNQYIIKRKGFSLHHLEEYCDYFGWIAWTFLQLECNLHYLLGDTHLHWWTLKLHLLLNNVNWFEVFYSSNQIFRYINKSTQCLWFVNHIRNLFCESNVSEPFLWVYIFDITLKETLLSQLKWIYFSKKGEVNKFWMKNAFYLN